MILSDSCILAIDAGGTSLKAALVPELSGPGRTGELTDSQLTEDTFFSVPVSSSGTREEILAAYTTLAAQGAAKAAAAGLTISRVSVCIPGPFDYAGGKSLMCHKYQAIYNLPLRPCLWEGIGTERPIVFLHDSTAFLLGACAQTATKAGCICGVIIGTGLGFACMRDGRIRQNPSGGPAVSIYARPYLDGTSEDYVSSRGILKQYLAETLLTSTRPPTVAEIAHMAKSGDSAALKVFADTGFHLGRILLPVLKEEALDTVLLGGAISKSAELFLPELNQVLADAGATAKPVPHIDLAPILGAARYCD